MQKKKSLGDFFEQYRLLVGGGLVLLVLASGGYLLWRENFWQPTKAADISRLEQKIAELENVQGTQTETVKPTDLLAANQPPVTAAADAPASPTTTAPKATSTVKGAATQAAPSAPKAAATTPATVSYPININTATLAQLDTLPSIGPAIAQNIIDYRNAHGPFTSIQQLDNVKNIGPVTIDKIKDKISL